eukprot:54906-Rhodomonas_salina.3
MIQERGRSNREERKRIERRRKRSEERGTRRCEERKRTDTSRKSVANARRGSRQRIGKVQTPAFRSTPLLVSTPARCDSQR